ncbi:MAG: hypothetical protein Q9188_002407 [Gyalolechia gomerana]
MDSLTLQKTNSPSGKDISDYIQRNANYDYMRMVRALAQAISTTTVFSIPSKAPYHNIESGPNISSKTPDKSCWSANPEYGLTPRIRQYKNQRRPTLLQSKLRAMGGLATFEQSHRQCVVPNSGWKTQRVTLLRRSPLGCQEMLEGEFKLEVAAAYPTGSSGTCEDWSSRYSPALNQCS